MTRRASVVSCSMVDCPSVQVVCVCVCEGGGGGCGVVKEGELTDCGEEGGEVGRRRGGRGGGGESRVMRWWG